MSASLDERGLSKDELSHTFIRFSRVWRRLGYRKNTAYQWVAEGRFPLEVIRDGNILYCYSSEVDGHVRGDHRNCWHSRPAEYRNPTKREETIARNLAMARAYNRGVTKAELARRFSLTPQRVNQILARWTLDEGGDDDQDDDGEAEEG